MATAELHRAVSLLEQCILYSNPIHNPFSNTDDNINQPNLQSETTGNMESSQAQRNDVEQISVNQEARGLLTINLDFSTPLLEGQCVTTSTTPLARSTNRRQSNPAKLHRSTRRCGYQRYRKIQDASSDTLSGLRPRQKSKPHSPVEASQLDQSTVSHISTMKRRFLSFPGEVRDLIYAHVFAGATICFDQNPKCRHTFDLHLALRYTCKAINLETIRPLFRQLTVQLSIHKHKMNQLISLNDQIPETVRDNLENLVVRIAPDTHLSPCPVPIIEMPSLRHIRIIDMMIAPNLVQLKLDFAATVEHYSAKAKADMKNVENNCRLRFKQVLKPSNLQPSTEYEIELWWQGDEPRAEHMGSLRRDSNRIMSLTYSDANGYAEERKELTTADWRSRCKMYAWMEKNCRFISRRSRSIGFDALLRLEMMQHHHELDRIEFGIAKAMKAARAVPLPKFTRTTTCTVVTEG